MTNNKNVSNHTSPVDPISGAQTDLLNILLSQDLKLGDHLKRAIWLISAAAFLAVVHQVFVLIQYPIKDWHSLAHIALLVVVFALIIGAWLTWFSYLELRFHQKAMLKAYTHSQSLLETLFGAITDRIVILDPDNRIVKANKVAAAWAGCDPTHYAFSEVFPACETLIERRSELNLIEFTRTSQEPHHGRLLRGGVDCSKLLSIDTYPVTLPENDRSLVVAIARDVTDQTARELAICHREKMAALGLLIAGFAHDLGNPLSSLSTELELLREEKYPEKVRKSLEIVEEHVKRIKRKLHDIVQFAYRPDENKQDVYTHEAIDHALKLTHFDPRSQSIHFKLNVDVKLPPVRMNEDDMVLVLTNLIVNAYDAMPRGGTLSIDTSMTITGDAVVLTVSDSGIGMDAATLKQATQPLFTTKAESSVHGTGLGFTMVEHLITSCDGEYTIASEPDKGTRIMLRLPLADIDQARNNGKTS